jgi:hypothetical protein
MAPKSPQLYLEHIRFDLIERYTHGRQHSDLDQEPILREAIERNIVHLFEP